jgi:hypothetical protein
MTKMQSSWTSVNSDAINRKQIFVKGDEGRNTCVQSDGYMVSVSGKQIVLAHQTEGKVFSAFESGQIDGAAVYFRFNDLYFVHCRLEDMWRTAQDIFPPLPCSSCLTHQSLPQDVKSDFVVGKVADNTYNLLCLQPPKKNLALKMKRVSVVPTSDDEGRIKVNDGFKGIMEVSPFCHFASTTSLAKVPQATQGLRCFLCRLSVPTLPSTVVSSLPLADKSNLFVSALPEFSVANLQAFSVYQPSFAPPAKKHNTLCCLSWHVDCDGVNREQIFIKGDEGGNSRVQSDGYMASVSGKQVVLAHQTEGKVTSSFGYGQSDCSLFQIGSDDFYSVHGFLKNMWSNPQDIFPPLPCSSRLTHQSLPQDVEGDLVVDKITHNANRSLRLQPFEKVTALKMERVASVTMGDDEGRIQVDNGFKGIMEVSPFCHFASTPSLAIVLQATQDQCQDNQPFPPEPLSTVVSFLPLADKSNLFVSALPEFSVANLQAFSVYQPSFAPPAKKHNADVRAMKEAN